MFSSLKKVPPFAASLIEAARRKLFELRTLIGASLRLRFIVFQQPLDDNVLGIGLLSG